MAGLAKTTVFYADAEDFARLKPSGSGTSRRGRVSLLL
jgi:hypothetical protein